MTEIQSDETQASTTNATVSLDNETSETDDVNQTTLPLAPAAHGSESKPVAGPTDELTADDMTTEPVDDDVTLDTPETATVSETEPQDAEFAAFYYGPIGKRRSLVAVIALCIITFGLYGLIWHNRNNRELADFDPQMRVHPGRTTWAVAIPWILGLLVTLVGAARIVLSDLNVALPFDPHFSMTTAYFLLAGLLVVPYLTMILPFSAAAVVMTAERIRIIEERVGKTSDVQINPSGILAWLLIPVLGPVVLIGSEQRRINAAWETVSPQSRKRR